MPRGRGEREAASKARFAQGFARGVGAEESEDAFYMSLERCGTEPVGRRQKKADATFIASAFPFALRKVSWFSVLVEGEAVVDISVAAENLLRGGGAEETDGAVPHKHVGTAGVPASDRGVDRRDPSRSVIRTEDAVGEEGRRGVARPVAVIGPTGLEALVDRAFVGGFVRAQVRAVVAP